MTKQEKLDKLDGELIDAMLHIMTKGKKDPEVYGHLSNLATVSNYLAKNNVVSDKKKSTLDDDIKQRTAEAKKRRENGNV